MGEGNFHLGPKYLKSVILGSGSEIRAGRQGHFFVILNSFEPLDSLEGPQTLRNSTKNRIAPPPYATADSPYTKIHPVIFNLMEAASFWPHIHDQWPTTGELLDKTDFLKFETNFIANLIFKKKLISCPQAGGELGKKAGGRAGGREAGEEGRALMRAGGRVREMSGGKEGRRPGGRPERETGQAREMPGEREIDR